jgi:site-specific DNA recombinase
MKIALGYTRISKEDDKSVSLDYQEAEIRKLCKAQGFKLVGIETDQGISGKSVKIRPAVQRVLQAVDNQTVDAVVVFKSDRMSRDGIESLQIEKLFLRKQVAYLSCTEGNLTSESVDDEFMSFIRAGLNQRERKLIGLRVRQALNRKREKGERIGGRPAYGYSVVDGKMIPDPSEQQIVTRIREYQSKGRSIRQITQALVNEGIMNRLGRPFAQTQIHRILTAA